jgi:glycosyltransferase involved in cell wall biosynthesis
MRIGVMLRHLEQQEGGVKVYTKNVLPRLLTLGSRHEFVLFYQNRRLLGTYAGYANVEEVAVPFPGTVTWDQFGLPLAARGRRLDLIFNPKMTVPLLTGTKTVFMAHGSETLVIPQHFGRLDILYRRFFRPLYHRRATACIAVSQAVKADLVKYLSADPNRIYPVHNGYDPLLFYPQTDASELRSLHDKHRLPERYILWVGQIEARKNIARLLQAFAQVAGEFPHSLVIVGERRRTGAQELQHIEQLGLSRRVHFTGWIPQNELRSIYCLADLFAFPSLHEGFGIPLLEAMACGCPIVAASTGSPPEVLAGAGYLVNPMSVADIASGMRAVLADATLRDDMVVKGLAQARKFGWEQTAQALLTVLEEVAAHR